MSIAQVLDLLSEITSILERHSVAQWEAVISARLGSLRQAAQMGDKRLLAAELEKVNGLFGGMGSFSDVYVSDRAGDDIDPSRVRSVNLRLQELRTELFVSVKR